ncbi:tail protein with lysin activity [Bacillus phage Hoody T]|uniref:Tail lysin 1 n=1 Tax=Bacillus phage Hoody T TaxID=1486660 RepID=A0A024B187_9CAUD|nr:tail protein with lysin activity [Bacillus phage Hoody T]AHZ10404.1 tail lysin 1 [Bacillus phage Hoody T]
MVQIQKRYPTIEVNLITENTSYEITYDTKKQLSSDSFENAIISLSTKNSMGDDSPAFSMIVTAVDKWDKIIGANDLIRIKAIPDVTDKVPDNPWIMVGMISDIKKEGEYSNGTLVYRITGQAMTKALINFQVGVIQQFAALAPDLGWLPDGTEQGLHFSGKSAASIANELMDRFLYKYAQYAFNDGKGLQDYFTHEFKSWEDAESLQDPSPFVNYQGSLRQFLEDIAAKPFNELYFDFTKDGRCIALMRPTPFDPENWNQLPSYSITSDIVLQESVGKNDVEAFSVYVVEAPNIVEYTSLDLGVYPRFHPELIKKYGYKRLDAQNRYLMTADKARQNNGQAANGTPATGGSTGGMPTPTPMTITPATTPATTPSAQPSFSQVDDFLTSNNFKDPEIIRKNKSQLSAAIKVKFPTMTQSMTNSIVDALQSNTWNSDSYTQIVKAATGDVNGATTNEKSADNVKLKDFTDRLFNWYCENPNFYSGDIRVIGNPMFRVGTRLLYEDFEQETTWEFYVESVQHEFSFTSGYSTILGVTRGLQDSGQRRFSNLWGKSEDFKGGYLGEDTVATLLEKAKKAREAMGQGTGNTGSGGMGGGAGGAVAMQALATAREMTSKPSVYVFGGGRSGNNPFLGSPIKIDCSSFVWWCYNLHGVQLNGGATGMTTDTIAKDSRLQVVSPRGGDKKAAMSQLMEGDIIYFDTYKSDGHIVIYSGNGKFIGSQSSNGIKEEDLNSSYWQKVFNGHVRRFVG